MIRATGDRLAAVVFEPIVVYEPDPEWLDVLREETARCGALLVVDEIKTVCRLAIGGASERYHIRPDLVVVGKALANGFPLARGGRSQPCHGRGLPHLDLVHPGHRVRRPRGREGHPQGDGRARGPASTSDGRAPAAERPDRPAAPVPGSGLGRRRVSEMCFLQYADEAVSREVTSACALAGLLFKRSAYNFVSLAHTEPMVDHSLELICGGTLRGRRNQPRLETRRERVAYRREEDAMSPRKPTIDDLDDIDDEDGVLEEEVAQQTDLDLTSPCRRGLAGASTTSRRRRSRPVLIDVHAHFLHDRSPRPDWRERNASRLRAGERVGITVHVASILGSWGATSPIYFPSPADIEYGNDFLLALAADASPPDSRLRRGEPELPRSCAEGAESLPRRRHDRHQARRQPPGRRSAARSDLPGGRQRRACRCCTTSGSIAGGTIPARRPRDAVELGALAARHPKVSFLLAHIGGGGDWIHSLAAVRDLPNVFVDLSGQRSGWRHARSLPGSGGRRAAALGLRSDHRYRLGQASLPGAPPQRRTDLELVRVAQCRPDFSAQRLSGRLMRIDVNSFLGAYPFRRVPGTSPDALLRRHGSAWRRSGLGQPSARASSGATPPRAIPGSTRSAQRHDRLRPVPAVHPGLPGGSSCCPRLGPRRSPARPVRSDLLRARSGRPGDASAGCRPALRGGFP